jgi:hypothetical protein
VVYQTIEQGPRLLSAARPAVSAIGCGHRSPNTETCAEQTLGGYDALLGFLAAVGRGWAARLGADSAA